MGISMNEQEFQLFADNYSSSDFCKIHYDWNGKYGNEFHDSNYDFRMALCQYLLPQIEKVNVQLIRDLFVETSKASAATFGAYINIHVYAQELLERDWRKYLRDYMQGGSYGMDAYLSVGRINIKKDIAQAIFNYVKETIEVTTDGMEKKLFLLFKDRFEWLATKES